MSCGLDPARKNIEYEKMIGITLWWDYLTQREGITLISKEYTRIIELRESQLRTLMFINN